MGRKHDRQVLRRLLERIVQHGEECLRDVRKPVPGQEMADPEDVKQFLARAHRLLTKKLLEMPTPSKRIR